MTNLDLIIAKYFFDPCQQQNLKGFAQFWNLLYRFGPTLVYTSLGLAVCIFVLGFFKKLKGLKGYRIRALFVILLIAIGPGIIVNIILKGHWKRPRPIECSEFNGAYQFEKILTPNWNNIKACRSFPSGHASGAFFMFFPFFLYRAFRKRKKAVLWLLIGLVYGGLMSVARMTQGGHFLSDCLWAGGIVYLVAVILYYALRLRKDALENI